MLGFVVGQKNRDQGAPCWRHIFAGNQRTPARRRRRQSSRMQLIPTLSRRALTTIALSAATTLPLHQHTAAAAADAGPLAQLQAAQSTLAKVDSLLTQKGSWPEAQRLLSSLDDGVLTKALEACADPASLKENLMNNAAFIVYYEERRYADTRLEPQTPGARAEQNGKKKEFLRALADERAELSFLLKQEDDPADLRSYSAAAQRSLREFLALVSSGS